MALLLINSVLSNRDAFAAKVTAIAKELGTNPDYLMGAMNIESGINPAAVNPTTNATGLIQFMPSTAISLGTSVNALRNMSNVDQLDYVRKYFLPYKGKLKTFSDVYCTVFYPAAVGKPSTYTFSNIVRDQNPTFKKYWVNGQLTKGSIDAYLKNRFPSLSTIAVVGGSGLIIVAIIVALILLYK